MTGSNLQFLWDQVFGHDTATTSRCCNWRDSSLGHRSLTPARQPTCTISRLVSMRASASFRSSACRLPRMMACADATPARSYASRCKPQVAGQARRAGTEERLTDSSRGIGCFCADSSAGLLCLHVHAAAPTVAGTASPPTPPPHVEDVSRDVPHRAALHLPHVVHLLREVGRALAVHNEHLGAGGRKVGQARLQPGSSAQRGGTGPGCQGGWGGGWGVGGCSCSPVPRRVQQHAAV